MAALMNFNVSMVCTEAYALPYDNGDFASLHISRRLITEIHAPHALASALHQTPWPLGPEWAPHQSASGAVSKLHESGCKVLQVSVHVSCLMA